MYIPILKNRTVELSVLKDLMQFGLSPKVIPMIEIIQQSSRSNSKKDYVEELEEIFGEENTFFIDIPKYSNIKTSESIQTFLTSINRQPGLYIDYLKRCSHLPAIPVLSYNPKETISEDIINSDIKSMRGKFNIIALRITPNHFSKIGSLESLQLTSNDYVLFDIDDKGHTNPIFKKMYKELYKFKTNLGFKTIIINSNRPSSFYNKNIVDGEPIEEIDNSLLEMYPLSSYKFDGFSDYACVSNTLPSTGGAISPAGIYYSKLENFFVGYKGRTQNLSEFHEYIAPSIMASEYWKDFSIKHHNVCPGCKKILEICEGISSGKNQGLWKGITMSHYIVSVDELLNKEK